MLEIKKIKTENGGVGISFVIQTSKIKQKYSALVCVFNNAKERVEQRLKLFRVAWQVLRANPESISLEKNGKENQLSFAWKDKPRNKTNNFDWKNFRTCSRNSSHLLEILKAKALAMTRKGHLVIQNNKKKIVKVATGISAVVLIICASVVLIPFINADGDKLCDVANVATDVVLVIDTSSSMAGGAVPSKCVWGIDNGSGCKYHYKDGFIETECLEQQPENPEDILCYGPFYTPPVPSKIGFAKTAAKAFVAKLKTNDQSALVSFNATVTPNKNLSNNHFQTATSTKAAIDDLDVGTNNGTNIADAITQGNLELGSQRSNPQAVKAIILLTDGKDTNTADLTEAVAKGYKIFTIGLGNNVDGTMLSSIAELTGAKKIDGSVGYYPAADGSELAGIYDQIATAICQYGSISGCKYSDANNNRIIDNGEEKLSSWGIILTDEATTATTTQSTDEQGCYKFAGLIPGIYTLSEILLEGEDWLQTVTPSLDVIEIDWRDHIEGMDFGNYLPFCGNGILDLTKGEVCDDGEDNDTECVAPYGSSCTYCSNECGEIVEIEGAFCGDGNLDEEHEECEVDEDCDGEGMICNNCLCEEEPLTPVCEPGNQQPCDTGELGICATGIQICSEQGFWGECVQDNESTSEICDNELDDDCDGAIDCDDSDCAEDLACQDEPEPEPEPTPPSGGGAVMIPHSILDVRPIDIVADSVTITWRTSFFATSQVIYSIEGEIHNFDPDNPPLYGYAHMTSEQDTNPKVTYHTVVIPGLSPEQTYYYRTISRASPAIFSNEFTFTTLASLAGEDSDTSDTPDISTPDTPNIPDTSDTPDNQISLEEMEEKLNEISNKVATIGQEVAKISPRVNVPAFASADSDSENLAYNDLDSEADDEEPIFADATTDEASFAEATAGEVNNEINDESDNSKFLAGIGTFFSNLEGWRLALILLLGIILALIILRLIKSLVGGNKNK